MLYGPNDALIAQQVAAKQAGDLYHRDFGDEVKGGQVTFNYRGEAGCDHHSVYGEGRHFSWDSYPTGDSRNEVPGPDIHLRPHT